MANISHVSDFSVIRIDNEETFQVSSRIGLEFERERVASFDLPPGAVLDERAIFDLVTGTVAELGGRLRVEINIELGHGWTRTYGANVPLDRGIIGGGILSAGGNSIRFALDSIDGTVTIRNAVLWFQRKVSAAPED